MALLVVVLLAFIAIVLVARFQRRCIDELADTPDVALLYLSRRAWFFLIACWIPLGGVFFLRCGRAR